MPQKTHASVATDPTIATGFLPTDSAEEPKGKVESIAARKPKVTTSIPTPVPTDREVCLKTITDESGSQRQEGYQRRVIQVMCKAKPAEKNAQGTPIPAKLG